MERKDTKLEITRAYFRLGVLLLLTVNIVRDDTALWLWAGARAAVLIEYICFSLKDELKDLIKNFIAHIVTGAVLAFGWYLIFVLFELKPKFRVENSAVLHNTVPLCIKWAVLLSMIGLTVSAVLYLIREKKYS